MVHRGAMRHTNTNMRFEIILFAKFLFKLLF